jgi:hypothetical protein
VVDTPLKLMAFQLSVSNLLNQMNASGRFCRRFRHAVALIQQVRNKHIPTPTVLRLANGLIAPLKDSLDAHAAL